MSDAAIDTHHLTKIFDHKTVVDNVCLHVKKGTIFGFLGSNGSGKTTMIRMICGLLTPSAGGGTCLGYDIKTQSADIKNNIGYMPQRFSLYNGLTVYENLQFFANIYQVQDPHQSIHTLLNDLDLNPYMHMKTGNLSGGWKQRLTLACCLIHQPRLLFLDEPTAGIDPKARKDFWNYLHKISIRDGTTVLVTTHYMDEAEKCTDLAYISLGKLLYLGATKDLVPFSHVKTYSADVNRDVLNQFTDIAARTYPELLLSVVNNELRVSSPNQQRLDAFIQAQSQYGFKPTPPSFEEVFIGLMQ